MQGKSAARSNAISDDLARILAPSHRGGAWGHLVYRLAATASAAIGLIAAAFTVLAAISFLEFNGIGLASDGSAAAAVPVWRLSAATDAVGPIHATVAASGADGGGWPGSGKVRDEAGDVASRETHTAASELVHDMQRLLVAGVALVPVLFGAGGFLLWSGRRFRAAAGERDRAEDAFRNSQPSVLLREDGAGFGLWSLDLRSDRFTCCDDVCRVFGWDRAPTGFDTYLAAVHVGERDHVRQALTSVLNNRVPFDIEHRILRPDGDQRMLRVKGLVKANDTGELVSIEGSVQDLTGLRLAEDRLRTLSQAVDQSQASIVISDVNGAIEYVNRAFTAVTGYRAEEVVGRHTRILKSGQTPDAVYAELWNTILAGRQWRGELCNRKKNGELFWEYASIAPVAGPEGQITHFLAVKEDLTLRKQYEERLLRQSNYDELTGLPNRMLATDRLESALSRARRQRTLVALLFIDLDDFKTINTTLSHSAGNRLLKDAGSRLSGGIRKCDTVARLGGDEFAVIVSDLTSPLDAEMTVQKIQDVFRRPFSVDGIDVFVGASIGVTVFPHDGDEAHVLMKNADAAVYRSKERGRDGYQFFTPDIDEHARARLKIASHLRKALDHDELIVNYQPIFDTGSRQLVAAEALLRWHSPELGLVPPDKFVPLAENIGLISAIGEWVLREGASQVVAWGAELAVLPRLAVNVSPRQFRDGRLVQFVTRALQESGLPPHQLELEITETLLLNDLPETMAILQELTQMGVRLSIDDFGTGYSSLSYLKKFPVSTLKIDRSFVADVTTDPGDAALVTAIVAMAHRLGLNVVGEGVETAEQLDFLHALGCDFVQGYHLCGPVPPENFVAYAQLTDEYDPVGTPVVRRGRQGPPAFRPARRPPHLRAG